MDARFAMQSPSKSRAAISFFWIAITLSAACFITVLGHESKFLWRFEQADIPLCGVLGALAVLAFLATELCDSLARKKSETSGKQPIRFSREE